MWLTKQSQYVRVAKLVNALASEASGETLAGSSPAADTIKIWAVGLLGVATCLADRTADGFKSHTVHQMKISKLKSLKKLKKLCIIYT